MRDILLGGLIAAGLANPGLAADCLDFVRVVGAMGYASSVCHRDYVHTYACQQAISSASGCGLSGDAVALIMQTGQEDFQGTIAARGLPDACHRMDVLVENWR